MKHKLLKIANDLNKLILHSDKEVKAEFQKYYEGGSWYHLLALL